MKSLLLSLALLSPIAMAAPEDGLPSPPLKAWGYIGCGEYYLWVVLPDGNVRRYDRVNGPQEAHAREALIAWIESAAPQDQDIVHSTKCGADT